MDKATQSKERISQALLDLMETTPYGDITIQAIVDRAEVSRMAFYRNFAGKNEVILYYIRKHTDEFIRESRIETERSLGKEFLRKLVDFMSRERRLGLLLIQADLFDMTRTEFERVYTSKSANEQEKLLSYFISGGICNVYHYWLCSGCREDPDDLVRALEKFLLVRRP